jgi:hypothetical protein
MAERYWRVLATTERVDEFFIEVDEFIDTPEKAAQHVIKDAFQGLDPENEHVDEPLITVNRQAIWVTDENGDRLPADVGGDS